MHVITQTERGRGSEEERKEKRKTWKIFFSKNESKKIGCIFVAFTLAVKSE